MSLSSQWLEPTRRGFLSSAVAAGSSLVALSPTLFFERNITSYWFIHARTGDCWAVDDPVSWSLENAREPVLEEASKRLLTLDTNDPQRVIRLVTRRCWLNLVEIEPRRPTIMINFG